MSKVPPPETRALIGKLRSVAPAFDDARGGDWEFRLRMRELGKMVATGALLGAGFLVLVLSLSGHVGQYLPPS